MSIKLKAAWSATQLTCATSAPSSRRPSHWTVAVRMKLDSLEDCCSR